MSGRTHDVVDVASLASGLPRTLLTIGYRDADNYKQHASVVLSTRADEAGSARLAAALTDDGFFVPGVVGLPSLVDLMAGGYDEQSDHPYHTVWIEPTDLPATDPRSFDEVVAAFEAADWQTAAQAFEESHA